MIADWIDFDGKKFDVAVTSFTESGEILYSSNTGRTLGIGAPMTLDPLGTFFNYSITVRRKKDKYDEYDRLFNYLLLPRFSGMTVTMPHDQGTITFDAYVSSAERTSAKIDEENKIVCWQEMSISVIATEAQVLPE